MDLRVPTPPTDEIKRNFIDADKMISELMRQWYANRRMHRNDRMLNETLAGCILGLFENLRPYMTDAENLQPRFIKKYNGIVELGDMYTKYCRKVDIVKLIMLKRELAEFMVDFRITALVPPKRID